jgi:hypothetical protein
MVYQEILETQEVQEVPVRLDRLVLREVMSEVIGYRVVPAVEMEEMDKAGKVEKVAAVVVEKTAFFVT